MTFIKDVKFGSVTMEMVLKCVDVLGLDKNNENSLRTVLHCLGFKVSEKDIETGQYKSCQVDKLENVNVRCKNKPYMFRKTTILSGKLRDADEYPFVKVYDETPILDVDILDNAEFTNTLDFDIPVIEKVNTRKYTKRAEINSVLMMEEDIPLDYPDDEKGVTEAINIIRGDSYV